VLELNKIYNMDCLEGMKLIPDKSIDMILCDLPYGITTRNKWDVIIPLNKIWEQYERIIKDKGAIALTSVEPFTSLLVTSNLKLFRYDIIWEKQKGSDPLNANRKPLRSHENILLFYKKQPTYNPQFTVGEPYIRKGECSVKSTNYNKTDKVYNLGSKDGKRYPKTVIKISNEGMNAKNLHPTQKPVELFEWLIKTYTNEGETVLDNCMGSGTTAIACINTNRNYIGFELSEEYCKIAEERIRKI
jgi:site-specific DNA-methyltransferase (adenine-specific)